MEKKIIVVVGAGKGLGNHVAEKFAQNDFKVVLMARNKEALDEYADDFRKKGFEASAYATDVTDTQAVKQAFDVLKSEIGTPDVMVYNAGITSPDEENLNGDDILHHYNTDVAGAYRCIQEVVTEEFGRKNGAIILTGGYAALNPVRGYLCLALDKAALRNLTLAMNHDLAPQGIFVGTVMVCGGIQPDTHFAPNLIAERFWQMYQERKDWELRYE